MKTNMTTSKWAAVCTAAEKDMSVQDVPYAELRKRLLDDKQVLAIVRR